MNRMKRLIAFLSCTVLVFALTACGTKEPADTPAPTETAVTNTPGGSTPAPTASPMEQALADAPEHYDFALQVSINPDFLLYVSGNDVIAYKALNEDARSIEDRCAIIGRGIEGAIEDIVRFSEQDGFLKEGGTVNMTVVRANCAKSQADEMMKRAEESVQRASKAPVKTAVQVDNSVAFAPEPPGPGPNDPNNDPGPETHEPRKQEGCSVCRGTGECERCDGTGVVECMACQGTGTFVKGCWKCKGTGKDETGNACPECAGTGNHGEETCQDCKGTGRAECEQCHGSKKCPACGGTGQKPED